MAGQAEKGRDSCPSSRPSSAGKGRWLRQWKISFIFSFINNSIIIVIIVIIIIIIIIIIVFSLGGDMHTNTHSFIYIDF